MSDVDGSNGSLRSTTDSGLRLGGAGKGQWIGGPTENGVVSNSYAQVGALQGQIGALVTVATFLSVGTLSGAVNMTVSQFPNETWAYVALYSMVIASSLSLMAVIVLVSITFIVNRFNGKLLWVNNAADQWYMPNHLGGKIPASEPKLRQAAMKGNGGSDTFFRPGSYLSTADYTFLAADELGLVGPALYMNPGSDPKDGSTYHGGPDASGKTPTDPNLNGINMGQKTYTTMKGKGFGDGAGVAPAYAFDPGYGPRGAFGSSHGQLPNSSAAQDVSVKAGAHFDFVKANSNTMV
jgi:hypothetical protein